MPITKLLSGLPSRTMTQELFDQAMAQMCADLQAWGSEVNETTSILNSIAAGGAYSIPYTFSALTAVADPGPGFIRLTSATQSASTVILADQIGADGAVWTAVLDTFDDSSSIVKGHILLQKLGDATRWLLFSVTSIGSPPGYKSINVVNVASSAANPFTDGDFLVLKFSRTGDKGDAGPRLYLHARDEKAGGTHGGTSVAATITQRRTLNTIKTNGIAGASLAGDQFVLPAGSYSANIRAPGAGVNTHRVMLYNVTDATYTLVGDSQFASSASSVQTDSQAQGIFTLSASKTFEVRHYTQTATTTFGLGNAANMGYAEAYTEVLIEKVG